MTGDPCNVLFRFPIPVTSSELMECSKGLNYFDGTDEPDDTHLLSALNAKKTKMDESGLSSILPNQCVNDDVVNFLVTW